ncbi:MAG: hypothetical protein L0Y54_02300 [Sporichthyaceae bacterium]|nr:hypothetical protein [Sporichthyaceae bacterium]
MIVGDWLVRLTSPEGAAWRRHWAAGLPARLVVAAPALVALALAGASATALLAGRWLTWVGVAAVVAYLGFGARPGPAVAALATIPAAVTVLLMLASPLRAGLVLAEVALLLGYLVLLDRWEAPGGEYLRRIALLVPGLGIATALVAVGLLVAGGMAGTSMLIAVLGLVAVLGAVVLTVRSGNFR